MALAVTTGNMAVYWVTSLIEGSIRDSDQGTFAAMVDWLIAVLLVILIIWVVVQRTHSRPPKWMGRLQTADPRFSFRLGFVLFLVMPTDVLTMLTVGAFLARHGEPWWHSLPFLFLTLLLAGVPLLILLLLGRRAEALLPRLRQWMTANSWVVCELVLVFFLAINRFAG